MEIFWMICIVVIYSDSIFVCTVLSICCRCNKWECAYTECACLQVKTMESERERERERRGGGGVGPVLDSKEVGLVRDHWRVKPLKAAAAPYLLIPLGGFSKHRYSSMLRHNLRSFSTISQKTPTTRRRYIFSPCITCKKKNKPVK